MSGGSCLRRLESFIKRVELEAPEAELEEPKLEEVEPGEVWWQKWGDAWPLLALHILRGGKASVPAIVVRPADGDEAAAVLRSAYEEGVCIVARGGGSGVLGGVAARGCCAVLDLSRLSEVLVDAEDLLVEAGAGVVLERLEEEARSRGLTLGYYPQSMRVATVGGAIASLGSGALQPGYGNVEDIIEYIDVATVRGEVVRLGDGPRGRLGPGLKDLFVGSEGTLGVVVKAGLRARIAPGGMGRAVVRFDSFAEGLKAARRLVQWNQPQVLRLLDADEASLLYGRDGPHLIIAYMDLDEGRAEDLASRAAMEAAREGGRLVDDGLFDEWWRERFSYGRRVREIWGAGLWFDTIDLMGRWSTLARAAEKVKSSLRRHSLAVFSHASHFYPTGGALYTTILVEPRVERLVAAWKSAMDAAESLGVLPTHHHGIGVQKLRAAASGCPGWYTLYCIIASALDPEGVLNPYGLRAGCRKCVSGMR
ncbi:MAG: FAD-binding oxidoreductase [Aeropyrum sp.]|nr:FAD-binding oxidoreductase [Aeropyrum sp.]